MSPVFRWTRKDRNLQPCVWEQPGAHIVLFKECGLKITAALELLFYLSLLSEGYVRCYSVYVKIRKAEHSCTWAYIYIERDLKYYIINSCMYISLFFNDIPCTSVTFRPSSTAFFLCKLEKNS